MLIVTLISSVNATSDSRISLSTKSKRYMQNKHQLLPNVRRTARWEDGVGTLAVRSAGWAGRGVGGRERRLWRLGTVAVDVDARRGDVVRGEDLREAVHGRQHRLLAAVCK